MKKVSALLLLFWVTYSLAEHRHEHKKSESELKTAINKVVDTTASATGAKRRSAHVVDEIICTIYGPERTRIVCRSDLKRMSMDGAASAHMSDKEKLSKIIIDELLFQETLRFKIPIEDTVIDNYILSLQQQHGMSMEDIKAVFKASGFTLEEGREQLRIMYAANTMIDLKIKSNVVITEKDVVAYYNAHPEMEEAAYQIQQLILPVVEGQPVQKVVDQAKEFIKTGKGGLRWSTPMWLQESELADSLRIVTKLDVNKPHILTLTDRVELYNVLDKKEQRVVPLEKRYRTIADELRKPKFEDMYNSYKQALLDNASIVYYMTV